jgi:hypothetical protein
MYLHIHIHIHIYIHIQPSTDFPLGLYFTCNYIQRIDLASQNCDQMAVMASARFAGKSLHLHLYTHVHPA